MTPEDLGKLADQYWEKRELRLEADKVASKLKAEENVLYSLLLRELLEAKITAIGGQKVRLTLEKGEVPVVKEWDKLYAYIRDTGEFDLLERRIGHVACRSRWELNVQVPGVEKFPVYKFSRSEIKS